MRNIQTAKFSVKNMLPSKTTPHLTVLLPFHLCDTMTDMTHFLQNRYAYVLAQRYAESLRNNVSNVSCVIDNQALG